MSFVPISFDVTRADVHKKSAKAYHRQVVKFEDLLTPDQKAQILERDDHTCQCCGFKSKKYQKIHFKDGDSDNTSPDNLITTCIYCYQCFHLDAVGQMKSGVLVWLPEIKQPILHHIMRSVYVARISQGDMATHAKAVIDMMMKRREEAKA